MNRLLVLTLIVFLLLGMEASSNANRKKDSSTASNSENMNLLIPNTAYSSLIIKTPKAVLNNEWSNSSRSLSNVPENIFLNKEGALSNKEYYRVHDKFSKNYQFIGNTPVVHDKLLFVMGGNSTVYAYNISNLKTPLWKKSFDNTEEDVFRGGGIFATKDHLAVTHGSNNLVILNTKTGKEVWHYTLSNISKATPLIYKGKVFVLTVDNKLYCLSLSTGLINWVYEGITEQLGVIKSISPFAYEDMVIVPYSVNQTIALNIDDGKLLWNLPLDEQPSSIGDLHAPIVNNGIAYISSYKGTLYALNLKTGYVHWTNEAAGGNSIWVAGDFIYVVNNYSQLAVLHKSSGKTKWVQQLKESALFSGLIMVNNTLYVPSSEGKLLMFSPITGTKLKEISIDEERYSPPIAAQNNLYLLSEKGKLLVFN